MKKRKILIGFMLFLWGLSMMSCCPESDKKATGFVTFGANYHRVNCMTKVSIYVDDVEIGTLENFTDSIGECGAKENITKELPIGKHTYKVAITSEIGGACIKDIEGEFTISLGRCEKIFIDYRKVLGDSACDQKVIISSSLYNIAPSDEFKINEMEIKGDCLHIKFQASGCSGRTWGVKLVDVGGIVKTLPIQKDLRLLLENKEDCEAMPQREVSFDIKSLQVEGYDKVYLNVSGKGILYEY